MNLSLLVGAAIAAGILLTIVMAPAFAANLRDATLKLTVALPNGINTVYATPGIDTGITTAQGIQPGGIEFLLSAPALTTVQLPDAKTMTYGILMDTVDPIDGSSSVLYAAILVQTGAGGAGAAAASVRFRLPSGAKRIIGFSAVNSGAGDATAASATLELLA